MRSALVSLVQLATAAIVELMCVRIDGRRVAVVRVPALKRTGRLAAEAVWLVGTAHRRRATALLHRRAQVVDGGGRCRFVRTVRFVRVRGTLGYVVQVLGGALQGVTSNML